MIETARKALLLVNLGTPEKPEKRAVRRYLSEFLGDRRVIDLPWLFRKALVHLVILPFRTGASTRRYQKLWGNEGSPLLVHLERLAVKLQIKLYGEYTVIPAMRYGKPSLVEALSRLEKASFEEICVLPLFPQYASSTSGSIVEMVLGTIRSWKVVPNFRLITSFHNRPEFIEAFAAQVELQKPHTFDHVLFSYHGLPYRHLTKQNPDMDCRICDCSSSKPSCGALCYKSACYETTRLLAQKLGLSEADYSVGFQSRLSKNWMSPFSDERIVQLARNQVEKVLVVTPSFVADCLETLVEVEDEYRQLFLDNGGKQLVLVQSLNDTDQWVEALSVMIRESNPATLAVR
ncbi:MAG TPA: ferrochelatase [Bacteroidales bacterium]|nr:ferrochelatase [Bacteroidales bacterium]